MSLRYSLLAAAFVAVAMSPATAKLPSQIVTFGDSLVDAGNLDIAVGSDFYNPVAKGYYPGRFTNGPDYTDLLNARIDGHYQTPGFFGGPGTNFAFGGARIVDTGDAIPDLTAQLATYIVGHAADPNALYIINLGGNDIFGLQANNIGSYTPASYVAAMVGTLDGAVQALDAYGARRILVTGIPNATPTGFAVDAQVQAGLDSIQSGLTNATLERFSYLNFFTRLAADPEKFGVAPFTHLQSDGCFAHLTPPATADCSGYFTVDGTHPIAPIQAAIFREVAHITGIGSVPEPTSWALMIAGFGLIGTALRRRTAMTAAA